VPFVRGGEKSRCPDRVLEEISSLREEGYGEITLLGQNVNSYSWKGVGFARLLELASEAADPAWIRFVTSHPRDFDEGLVSVMASRSNVCNQLHLPVQSGDDGVLEGMGRGYTRREYLKKIDMLRELVPEVVLSTDILVGFPGESESAFSNSFSLLEEARFDYAFLFKYSPRRGTAAATMSDQIPEQERLRRLYLVQDLQRDITIEKSRATEGARRKVLVTGSSPRGEGQQAGRTEGNRLVVLDGTDYPAGSRVDVRILRADGWTHFAEPIELAGDGS
jgi:tRNA-2-methylthio-N6-dimethylallyladenosine synthase